MSAGEGGRGAGEQGRQGKQRKQGGILEVAKSSCFLCNARKFIVILISIGTD